MRVEGLGFRVQGSGFRFRVQGLKCRVEGTARGLPMANLLPCGEYVSGCTTPVCRRDKEFFLSSSFLSSSLELSDTTIYEPWIQALVGTAGPFCEAIVFELRTVPLGTVLN